MTSIANVLYRSLEINKQNYNILTRNCIIYIVRWSNKSRFLPCTTKLNMILKYS